MNCFVCKADIGNQEVQQPIFIDREPKPAHYHCGMQLALSEIEVFKIEHAGSHYFDASDNCLDALKDIEVGDEYIVSKVKMMHGKYHSMPEFGGF